MLYNLDNFFVVFSLMLQIPDLRVISLFSVSLFIVLLRTNVMTAFYIRQGSHLIAMQAIDSGLESHQPVLQPSQVVPVR